MALQHADGRSAFRSAARSVLIPPLSKPSLFASHEPPASRQRAASELRDPVTNAADGRTPQGFTLQQPERGRVPLSSTVPIRPEWTLRSKRR